MQFLDEAVRQAQAAIEHKFLFRKLGLPYDYACPPDEFPSKTLATAREARSNLPNPKGMGSGYFHSCRNHALLFDAYLLKVELGIESGADEQILDRLIGGLIRIATVAPKSFLVGGLAPDGRGFYAWTGWENHAAWAFAAVRGLKTAAIAPESQEKFRSIVGKWIDRLQRDRFAITAVDGRPLPDGDLAAAGPGIGPVRLALLLTAALASRAAKDQDAYEAAAEEQSRARLSADASFDAGWAPSSSLWRQVALSVVAENDFNAERAALAGERLRENARAAARRVAAWRSWDRSHLDAPVDWNWRNFARDSDAGGLGFAPPASWARLDCEKVLEEALAAMYVALLARDAELLAPLVPDMEECLASVPWDGVLRLSSLAPAVGVHARGAELGLWDEELFETRRDFRFAGESLAAKYLDPDYDRMNPDRAGHSDPPPGKRPAEGESEGAKRRKRRRRR